MARACKICGHADRAAIEAQLAQGGANLRIATNFKNISEANLRNHRSHFRLPAKLEQHRRITFDGAFQRHFRRLEKVVASFDEILADGDKFDVGNLPPAMLRVYLEAIGKLHVKLEMMAKISGKYEQKTPLQFKTDVFAQFYSIIIKLCSQTPLTPETALEMIRTASEPLNLDIAEVEEKTREYLGEELKLLPE